MSSATRDREVRHGSSLAVSQHELATPSTLPAAVLAGGGLTSLEPWHLARVVHPSARRDNLSQAELLHLVGEICDQVPIERPTAGSSGGRRYLRLFRTEAVEAWIIAWAPSAYLGLHDHGISRGAFQILAGQLREVSTDLVDREPLTTLTLQPGARRSLEPLHVHDLWNPTHSPALSVHVYSPPLRSMSFYSDEPASYLTKLHTETEAEWPDPEHWTERAVG